MGKLKDFARSLNDVYLNGAMENCVVSVKDNTARIMAIDLTSSVFIDTSCELETSDSELGIQTLPLLVKYVNSIAMHDTKVRSTDKTLIFKPTKGSRAEFLLCDPEFVPTYESDWDEDVIGKELEDYEYSEPIKLDAEQVEEFTKTASMFGPSVMYIKVDAKGSVVMHGGKETENQFDITIGKAEGVDNLSIKVLAKHMVSVLSIINFEQKPVMYLSSEEGGIIIRTETSNWLLQPVEDNAKGQ